MSHPTTREREKGTYTLFDNAFLDDFVKTLPARQGIIFYLERKKNYNQEGASKGELLDALDCAAKTLDNTIGQMLAAGEIEQHDGRFFPASPHVSPDNVLTLSPKLGTKSGKRPPKEAVQDVESEPLKEEKEKKKEKEERKDPPSPPRGKGEQNLSAHEFDPETVELPPTFDRQQFTAFCAERLRKRKPMSHKALELFLAKHGKHPPDVLTAMFENAIIGGWQDLYDLKPQELKALRDAAPQAELSPVGGAPLEPEDLNDYLLHNPGKGGKR